MRSVVDEDLVAYRTSGIVVVFVEMDVVYCPANVEDTRGRTSVVADAGDGHGAGAGTAVVAPREGVVGILNEGSLTIDDGRFRLWLMIGVAHPIVARRHGDCSVAVGHRWVGHIVENHSAEGLARRDGDGERIVVAAGRNGAACDIGAALGLDRGAIEPQRAAFDGHRERAAGDNVGESGPYLEVELAVEGDVDSPVDHCSVTECVA